MNHERVNVLIVDDRPDNLLTMEAVIGDEGYNIYKASSGREALNLLQRFDFAVVLLDVQMPDMDGFTTAEQIKKSERAKDTPIIFVTAINKDERHVFAGYESGAVDYIFKPFDPFVLKSKVRVFVRLFAQASLLRESEQRDRERLLNRFELENLRRYKNLTDAVPHAIIKTEPTGFANHFNNFWFDYTGHHQEQSVGKGWQAFFNTEDFEKLQALWKEAMRTGANFELECRLRRGIDNMERWHLVRVVAEKGSIGETSAWIFTCTDIHALKLAEEENARNIQKLADRTVALETSNHDLEQFAYVASHDLQEPLRKVTNYIDLLLLRYGEILTGEARKYFDPIVNSVQRMQQLINDLLAFSRVAHEPVDAEMIDATIDTTLEIKMMLDTVEEADQAIVTMGYMPAVSGNPVRVRQLFQNLLTNAIKFRSTVPARIYISAKRQQNQWLFSVNDNGIGIAPQYHMRIFEIFQRLHNRTKYPGTGIGLAICKKIVESHGGRIWVESEPGQGSTFYFTLPLCKEDRVGQTSERIAG